MELTRKYSEKMMSDEELNERLQGGEVTGFDGRWTREDQKRLYALADLFDEACDNLANARTFGDPMLLAAYLLFGREFAWRLEESVRRKRDVVMQPHSDIGQLIRDFPYGMGGEDYNAIHAQAEAQYRLRGLAQ